MTSFVQEIETKAAAFLTDLRDLAGRHEAQVDRVAEDAQAALQSPVAAAAAAAVHVPDSVLGKIAELIGAAEAEYAKLAGPIPAPAAEPAPDASQENMPEPGPPMAAGPVVGGQAS